MLHDFRDYVKFASINTEGKGPIAVGEVWGIGGQTEVSSLYFNEHVLKHNMLI